MAKRSDLENLSRGHSRLLRMQADHLSEGDKGSPAKSHSDLWLASKVKVC